MLWRDGETLAIGTEEQNVSCNPRPRPIFREDSFRGASTGFILTGLCRAQGRRRRWAAGMGSFRQGRPLTLVVRGPSQTTPGAAPPSASTPRSSPCTVRDHAIQPPSWPPSRLCDAVRVDISTTATYDGTLSACRPAPIETVSSRVWAFFPRRHLPLPARVPASVPGLLLQLARQCHPVLAQYALISFSILAFVSLLAIPTFVPFSSSSPSPHVAGRPRYPKLHSLASGILASTRALFFSFSSDRFAFAFEPRSPTARPPTTRDRSSPFQRTNESIRTTG
ncbi:hypothetical protein QBC39DRAFT_114342 [Podospora conica]|nr:hypothetical protein QBC39DRAFT_114342 [Schizothecium conicum]